MDDPDHIAIKARAKEMQRQEMEEIRQREANETALQAIGFPKKRQKTGSSGGLASEGAAFGEGGGGSSSSKNNGTSVASSGPGLGKSSSLTNNGGSSGDAGALAAAGAGSASAGGSHFGSSTKPVSCRVVHFWKFNYSSLSLSRQ